MPGPDLPRTDELTRAAEPAPSPAPKPARSRAKAASASAASTAATPPPAEPAPDAPSGDDGAQASTTDRMLRSVAGVLGERTPAGAQLGLLGVALMLIAVLMVLDVSVAFSVAT